jgi:hypothetical protein
LQVKVNVAGSLITTDSEPLTGLEPDQLPDAVQVAAFVDDQLRVIVLPRASLVGLEVMLTVGAVTTGGALTVTVTLSLTLPPSPSQVIAYVVVALGVTASEPLGSIRAFQSAVQAVA